MTGSAKIALQIALNELIAKRDQLKEMSEQYKLRAHKIDFEEIPEFGVKIEEIRGDLE